MSAPEACMCKICLCFHSTRDKDRICKECKKGNHEGDERIRGQKAS